MATARSLYEGVLIELRKENAPNIMLEDFNHFANRAINQYINKRYNIYDINQQTTDDLSVLKATAILKPEIVNAYSDAGMAMAATYYVDLPQDYLHMLNCICIYDVKKTYSCYDKGTTWRAPAKRLTADAFSQVLDNFWNKPTYKKPYYYIHNVNTSGDGNNLTSNPWDGKHGTDAPTINTKPFSTEQEETTEENFGKDAHENTIVEGSGLPTSIKIGDVDNASFVERGAQLRYGNRSVVRCEIRYGSDTNVFQLKKVYIDYIKAPQHIRLTQTQLDHTEDYSQILEFPDYVCQEILNELVHIIMENISDQRLQTHPVVSQSIANPAQQQTEPVAQAT